jgi:hypothetical protein
MLQTNASVRLEISGPRLWSSVKPKNVDDIPERVTSFFVLCASFHTT